jgi:putative membrane protein
MGLLYGFFVLAFPTMVSDLLVRGFLARGDIVFTLRRCTALSLVSCVLWVASMIVGGSLQIFLKLDQLLVYATIFGMSVSVALRLLTFSSVSLLDQRRAVLSAVIQPCFCFASSFFFLEMNFPLLSSSILGFGPMRLFVIASLSCLLLLAATSFYIYIVDERGRRFIGIGGLQLLKGFVADWAEGSTTTLEDSFEKLGGETTIPVTLFAFGKEEKIEAVVVVPLFHPGPFKNVGSSNLPYLIQRSLEDRLGSIVTVPHGTSSHELNLTSQHQCEKVIQGILNLADFSIFSSAATRLFRGEVGHAKATCQFFGKCGLITLTCAPENMEDVPFEVGERIASRCLALGGRVAAVIDAHNSIKSGEQTPSLAERDLVDLQEAAESAIIRALNDKQSVFKIGAARVVPSNWGLEQGMGYGGIAALVVLSEEQRVAYIVVDGNNMVSGLREKILEALKELGIDEGEVLTTDTHAVNAIALVERGYRPVGEVIDHGEFVSQVKETVSKALLDARESKVSCKVGEIRGVKAFGRSNLVKLGQLVDMMFSFAKMLAFAVFPPAIMLVLLLFILF